MKPRLNNFINYVKEAFFHPWNLMGLGITGAITVATMVLLGALTPLNPLPLLLILGGFEMLYLGFMTRSDRFIKAINAKHGDEIQAFYRTEAITEYYNSLSAPRQRRFEHFKIKLDEIRTNYQNLHGNFPTLINKYLEKIGNLQMSYVRLLFMQDKFPDFLKKESPDDLKRQISEIQKSMETDSPKLKQIKQKRVGLIEKRIVAFHKTKENGKVVSAQLQTIEEMIEFIKDSPVTMTSTDEEDALIDNILFETDQMQDTISDMESIMSTGYTVGDYGSMGGNEMDFGTEGITE